MKSGTKIHLQAKYRPSSPMSGLYTSFDVATPWNSFACKKQSSFVFVIVFDFFAFAFVFVFVFDFFVYVFVATPWNPFA